MVDHHVVAGLQQTPQCRADGRHAGCDGETGFRALQTRDALLEQCLRRIARATVDIAFTLAAKKRLAFLGGLEGVGRRHENRRGQRAAMIGGVVPEMDGSCCETLRVIRPFFVHLRRPPLAFADTHPRVDDGDELAIRDNRIEIDLVQPIRGDEPLRQIGDQSAEVREIDRRAPAKSGQEFPTL